MEKMKIKTRFAPSPTGYLHIGGARTALYSWLFSRNQKGTFLLRIEDTDQERSKKKAVKAIIEAMKWLNLDWDEGPYYQTERMEKYNAIIDKMLKEKTAYKCYCSKDRLNNLRLRQIINGKKPRYDGHCRNISHQNSQSQINKKDYVVRFCNPQQGEVLFEDIIRGPIRVSNNELDDLILLRSDGSPTYNFCVAIDDWEMQITHVIRGEDHINNTLRQINILKALGAIVPYYAHVSLILDDNGKRLSKRNGSFNIMQYRDEGYLPEAVLNYLVRLGWSYGNKEIFSIEEMKCLFTLDNLSKSASMFDKNKLLWYNHHYINSLSVEYVASQLQWHIKQAKIDTRSGPPLTEVIRLFGNRCKTLKEIIICSRYLYEEFNINDIIFANQYLKPSVVQPLKIIDKKLSIVSDKTWTVKIVKDLVQSTANEVGIELNKFCMALRVAVTGSNKSPAINVIIHAIGKKRVIKRINNALKFIQK